MDSNVIFMITLILVAIISLIVGIFLLIKYYKTRNKLYLIFGVLLTFIVPPIVIYFVFRISPPTTMIDYGPGPIMAYGPGPI
jgi:hypothetical protein